MLNGTMMQYFHWYCPDDGSLWKEVKERAASLAALGITAVWLPPAYKGMAGAKGTGYDVYDLYDLGEFDQKGSVRTKFGTKEEYRDAVQTLHDNHILVYVDVVLNHMGGADEKETVQVIKADPDNRNHMKGEPFTVETFTKFTFPGRNGRYSQFIWDHHCFTGIDRAAGIDKPAVLSIVNEYGDDWDEVVGDEKGNYDYLMLADIEFRNPAVREELKKWGEWYLREIPFDGVRLDAIKHISPAFFNEWLDHMRGLKPGLFAVGEYWAPGCLDLALAYIEATEGRMSLFDACLHNNFHIASEKGKEYNLSAIFHDTLVAKRPELAVTLVDNHDTQPLQSLEAPVKAWFKPLAYALILLREGGYPCLFYPDLYGAHYTDKGKDGNDYEIWLDKVPNIDKLLMARNKYAYGMQRDYFDHPNCIGWTREGAGEHAGSGCAVVLSNSEGGFKNMEMGKAFAGQVFTDYLQHHPADITINEDGWAVFPVKAGSVSVWVKKDSMAG